MRFRFAATDDPGRPFTAAERRLVLGGPTGWRLTRDSAAGRVDRALRGGAPDALGRVHLGPLEWSRDGRDWQTIRPFAIADPADPANPHPADELAALTTDGPPGFDRPRSRVWVGPLAPGRLALDLGAEGVGRVQVVFDRELPALIRGRIPLFVQDGWSDREALGWLARLVTAEIDPGPSPSPPAVVLTGRDGGGWQLVPLHGLAARPEVPVVGLPRGVTALRFEGWAVPAPGSGATTWSPHARCASLRAEGEWDPVGFGPTGGATVLPATLPPGVAVVDGPAGGIGKWVVQVRDRLVGPDRHRIDLLVCDDPAAVFGPRPPTSATAPGGVYWAETGRPATRPPDWTVPCRLRRFGGTTDLSVLLASPYTGRDQIGGLHLVPEAGTGVLVLWTGQLSDPPVVLTQPRPVGRRKTGPHPTGPDVRDLGPTAVQFPPPRELVLRAEQVRVDADRDVRVRTRGGRIVLARDDGRRLHVGPDRVEVDPAEGPA